MLDDEKWLRVRHSAKHLLAAVVFNESSTASLKRTHGSLLACMGYYYVAFHAAVAMLWLCPSVAASDLKRVRHSQLKKLIEVHLVQRKLLERSFLDKYKQLQEFREYANYNFGSKLPKFEYTEIAPTISVVTGSILTKTIDFLSKELASLDMTFAFQSTIGDDIGSDLIKLHAGHAVAKCVWTYLVDNRLTT